MLITEASKIFAELGHPARLSIIRELVKAGQDGLNTGDIGQRLNIPNSTLTHHINKLEAVLLIKREKISRRLVCRINFELIRAVSNFLLEECCSESGPYLC